MMGEHLGIRGALIATLAGAVAAVGLVAPAASQAPADRGGRAGVLSGLVECRKIAEGSARLACYDRAADVLDRAEQTGEVTVIDRAQAKTLRRQAFGFELPSLSFFSHGAKEESVDKVAAVIDHASFDRNGHWRFVTEDGAVWVQVDDESLSRDPRKGSQIAIRKAALGSFFCNVDGQRALRCQRQH